MEAITREEMLMSGQQLEPITRKELFLAKAAGMDVQTPEPITREEMFLSKISGGGGGAAPVVEPLTVTENGTYSAPDGVDGYSPVAVNVASGGSEMEEQFIRLIEGNEDRPLTKLPEGLTKIRDGAFYDCRHLIITSLPNSVTRIGNSAFDNCTNIVDMTFHNGVNYIDNFAFNNCVGLNKVTFEGKPDFLGEAAFWACDYLYTINVPWAEGEVANAPWGATNATINYNYTGG